MSLAIAIESPLTDDVRALVAALNEFTYGLTPAEYRHHMTVEQMAQPDTTLFVARDEDGAALGMGALRRHDGGVGEVKRMYVTDRSRRETRSSARPPPRNRASFRRRAPWLHSPTRTSAVRMKPMTSSVGSVNVNARSPTWSP